MVPIVRPICAHGKGVFWTTASMIPLEVSAMASFWGWVSWQAAIPPKLIREMIAAITRL